ncbi:MAG: SPFH domain-containing protein [Alphaproteobacteria bacterium]
MSNSKTTTGCILAVLAVIVALPLLGRMCAVRVRPGEVGVRTDVWTTGLVKEDFGPGWHRNFGPMHQWVFFDSTVQTLEMAKDSFHADDMPGDSLVLISADGNRVDVDVTVKYRIREGQAHVLYQKKGAGSAYKETFKQNALDACRTFFGRMKTEDFYNPTRKIESCDQAEKLLQERVDDLAIEVIDILIRDVRFNPEYERRIKDKALAQQEVEVNQSKTKAAEQKGITMTIEAETEAKKQQIEAEKAAKLVAMEADLAKTLATIKAEAVTYETNIKAEADLYTAKKQAEGQLAIKQAEAEGERLRNQAMQGVGGAIMVALEAAKNLKLGDVVVSTQITDFLDIEGMIEKLGAPTAAEIEKAGIVPAKAPKPAPAKPKAKN